MVELSFCIENRAAVQDPSSIDGLDRLHAEVRRAFVGVIAQLERGDLTIPVATILLAHGHGRSLRSHHLAAMRAISSFHSGRARAGTVTSVLATR